MGVVVVAMRLRTVGAVSFLRSGCHCGRSIVRAATGDFVLLDRTGAKESRVGEKWKAMVSGF